MPHPVQSRSGRFVTKQKDWNQHIAPLMCTFDVQGLWLLQDLSAARCSYLACRSANERLGVPNNSADTCHFVYYNNHRFDKWVRPHDLA